MESGALWFGWLCTAMCKVALSIPTMEKRRRKKIKGKSMSTVLAAQSDFSSFV